MSRADSAIAEKKGHCLLIAGVIIFGLLLCTVLHFNYFPPVLQGVPTIKFMFSKKATKIETIFTINLTLCSKCQIHSEDYFNFCGLLRKHKLYVAFTTTDPTTVIYGLCTRMGDFCVSRGPLQSQLCKHWFFQVPKSA